LLHFFLGWRRHLVGHRQHTFPAALVATLAGGLTAALATALAAALAGYTTLFSPRPSSATSSRGPLPRRRWRGCSDPPLE
jgi:glutamate-1-semialdehyde aminotransferase